MTDPITPAMAEEALTEALEILYALPDRERGYQAGSAGRNLSAWPDIVRDRLADYPDDEATPPRRIGRREMALLERMLIAPRSAIMAVPVGRRHLVGRIVAMKHWPGPRRFSWERVWIAERAMLRRRGERIQVTSETIARNYSRDLTRVARRMDALGLGR